MRELYGTSACAGLALGPAKVLSRRTSPLGRIVQEPLRETSLFEAAVVVAKDEITQLSERASAQDKAIFTFQIEVLSDRGLLDEILRHIAAGTGAAAAVERAASLYAAKIRSIPDEYLSQRAGDIQDACRRVVDILDGRSRERLSLEQPCILIADELLPSDLISVDRSLLLGVATAGGSVQNHASIIARTFGIPTVVLAGSEILTVSEGTICGLDGTTGQIIIDPDEAAYTRYSHRIHLARRRSFSLEKLRDAPCVTRDGVRVHLFANCSGPEDIEKAIAQGAEGVGLLRSELLFLDGAIPDEEQQYAFYRSCLKAAAGRPVTIRTLDIGSDKTVAGLTAEEPNPALGLRGVRFSLEREDLFYPQLAALLRAGLDGPLRVMFPMIASPEDLSRTLDAVEEVRRRLTRRGTAFCKDVLFGIMVETPAAVLMAEELAQTAAFFSVGTNDLTQYLHAADRVNPAVQDYFLPASPAVLRALRMVLDATERHQIPVSICGESAADPDTALLYVQSGIRQLSLSAPSLLEVKARLMDENVLMG